MARARRRRVRCITLGLSKVDEDFMEKGGRFPLPRETRGGGWGVTRV
jgi:hypothetical protein